MPKGKSDSDFFHYEWKIYPCSEGIRYLEYSVFCGESTRTSQVPLSKETVAKQIEEFRKSRYDFFLGNELCWKKI